MKTARTTRHDTPVCVKKFVAEDIACQLNPPKSWNNNGTGVQGYRESNVHQPETQSETTNSNVIPLGGDVSCQLSRRALSVLAGGMALDLRDAVVELYRAHSTGCLPRRQARAICLVLDLLPDDYLLEHLYSRARLAEARAIAREALTFWAAEADGVRGPAKCPPAAAIDALDPQSYPEPRSSASEREYQRRTDAAADEYARHVERARKAAEEWCARVRGETTRMKEKGEGEGR